MRPKDMTPEGPRSLVKNVPQLAGITWDLCVSVTNLTIKSHAVINNSPHWAEEMDRSWQIHQTKQVE